MKRARHGRLLRSRAGPGAGLLSALVLAACGPRVETHPVGRLPPRAEDAPVGVYVRSEKLPACAWEEIGTVDAEQGWVEDVGRSRVVLAAVRRMGGEAVIVAAPSDAEGDVIRFLDPLCDPSTGGTRTLTP